MRDHFSSHLVPDESVLNRIRLRRKGRNKILVVEGLSDETFVREYLPLKREVEVVISNGKDNAIQITEELGGEREFLALIDWDYEWLDAHNFQYPISHVCLYDAHSSETFQYFFGRVVIQDLSTICARWLGVLRAYNHRQSGSINFKGSNDYGLRDELIEIFEETMESGDDEEFVKQMLGLLGAYPAFGINAEQFRNEIAEQVVASCHGQLEYVIQGHDLEMFHDLLHGVGSFRASAEQQIESRIQASTFYKFLRHQGFFLE